MTKVAMWSGPRSISTALMRSFENRPDTFVSDEPFYAHYLLKSGLDHPYGKETILYGETNWDTVVKYITGEIPDGKNVWYQKHMAQHNIKGCDLGWISKTHNILLIRHPREVILSYIKKYKINSILQLGYPQQKGLYYKLNSMKNTPIILDARDVLGDPEGMLKKLCIRLNIPFYNEMLKWRAGRRTTDGIWGKHWYDNVEISTGFIKYVENNNSLPIEYKPLYNDCMECYQQLYQHRMRLL